MDITLDFQSTNESIKIPGPSDLLKLSKLTIKGNCTEEFGDVNVTIELSTYEGEPNKLQEFFDKGLRKCRLTLEKL